MVFARAKVAVFIDGCFWHGCPQHYIEPATNVGYWRTKIAGNTERDRDTDERLKAAGWLVVRIWEHESTALAASRVAGEVQARLAGRAKPDESGGNCATT